MRLSLNVVAVGVFSLVSASDTTLLFYYVQILLVRL